MKTDPKSYVSDFGGIKVLVAMATEQEYGPELRRLINPLVTGVGPVEAAAATGEALGMLAAADALPDFVFSGLDPPARGRWFTRVCTKSPA